MKAGGIMIRKLLLCSILLTTIISAQQFVIINAGLNQISPKIGITNDCYFVVWEDDAPRGIESNIIGTTVNDTGLADSTTIRIHAPHNSNQMAPSITSYNPFDHVTIVWLDYFHHYTPPEHDSIYVMMRKSNCIGPFTTEKTIAEVDSLGYDYTDLAFSGTHYINVWMKDSGTQRAKCVIFDSTGTPTTGIIDLSTSSGGFPSVAYNGSEFLIVWYDSTSSGQGIFGEYYDSFGISLGPSFLLINNPTAIRPHLCSISGSTPAENRFAITWQSYSEFTNYDINMAIIDHLATTAEGLPISRAPREQTNPSIAYNNEGFFVVWQDNRKDSYDIYSIILDKFGIPYLDDFPICEYPQAQTNPDVAYHPIFKKYLTVWQDRRSGVKWDIFGNLIDDPEFPDFPYISTSMPFENEIITCDTTISFYISIDDAIDPATVVISFDGLLYRSSDPEVWVDSSFVFFHPDYPDSFEDTIIICIDSLMDITGSSIPEKFCRSIIWDNLPPRPVNVYPAPESVSTITPTSIWISLYDISPIRLTEMVLNDSVFSFGATGLNWDGRTASLNIFSLGIILPETNIVCVRGSDVGRCPNEFEFCWRFYKRDVSLPSATIRYPDSGSVSACSSQAICMWISDREGIDPFTIKLRVNGMLYSTPDPHITFSAPSMVFNPLTTWSEGEVSVVLTDAKDILGYSIPDSIMWSFYIDLSPPHIDSCSYGTEVDIMTSGDFFVYISDNYSDSLTRRSKIRLFHIFEDYPSRIATWPYDSLMKPIPMIFGIQRNDFFGVLNGTCFYLIDTFKVCVLMEDYVDYCNSNRIDTCWEFTYRHSGIIEMNNILPDYPMLTLSPNPFNSTVQISFEPTDNGLIEIFDISGRLVVSFATNKSGSILWDGCSQTGHKLGSGVYFVHLRCNNIATTKKLTYIK